ncbi:hypothetical protein IMCC26134_09060 [Verrucomicrobia bacterium IMCC26134]|nr:hypothetical protein IMCC26134_09060 [Verrucomicrobia bacterium IMCC26134]
MTVTNVAAGSLPLPIPGGLTFVSGFSVGFGTAPANPFGISITAPIGAAVGEQLLLFRSGRFLGAAGVLKTGWALVDVAFVGVDGVARTASPPFDGATSAGTFMAARGPITSFATITPAYTDAIYEVITLGGESYYIGSDSIYDSRLPLVSSAVKIRVYRTYGDVVTLAEAPVTVVANVNQVINIDVADPYQNPQRPLFDPRAELVSGTGAGNTVVSSIKVTLTNLESLLGVTDVSRLRAVFATTSETFSLDEARRVQGVNIWNVTPSSLSGDTLEIVVPSGLPLGSLYLEVQVKVDYFTFTGATGRDPVATSRWEGDYRERIALPVPHFIWVVNTRSDTVSVIDPLPSGGPVVIRTITVGRGPSDAVVSADGRYVYVSNTAEGTISIIDAIALTEIDLKPSTPGVIDRIVLNGGNARPWYITLSPALGGTLPHGFVTDRDSARVYEFSTDLAGNDVTAPLAIYDLRILTGIKDLTGLTGITVTQGAGTNFLVVASPGAARWSGGDSGAEKGYIFWTPLTASNLGDYGYNKRQFLSQEVGYKPFGVTPGARANQVAVAVRGNDIQGVKFFELTATTATLTNRVVMDFAKADAIRRARQEASEALSQNLLFGAIGTIAPFVIQSLDYSVGRTWNAKNFFDVNNAESIAFTADFSYAFVVCNNTFNGDTSFDRDPTSPLNHGGNLAIIRDPFGKATLLAATEEVPFGWPDEVSIDPYNQLLFVSFKGVSQVRWYNVQDLTNLAEAQYKATESGKTLDRSIDRYAEENKLAFDHGILAGKTVSGGSAGNTSGSALPSGVASSPTAPSDVIALGVDYIEPTGDGFAKFILNYAITGKVLNTKELFVDLYRSTLPDWSDVNAGITPAHTWTLRDASELALGNNQVDLNLTTPLAVDKNVWWIVRFRPVSGEDTTNNNDVSTQSLPGRLIATWDGDPDEYDLGRYVKGVDLTNIFTLRIAGDLAPAVDRVELTVGTETILVQKRSVGVYKFTLNMGGYSNGTVLSYRALSSNGVVVSKGDYTIYMVDQPDWATPGKYPAPTGGTTQASITWSTDHYVIERTDWILSKKWDLPANFLAGLVKSPSIAASFGSFFGFDFSLGGEASNLWVGPAITFNFLGYQAPRISLPLTGILDFMTTIGGADIGGDVQMDVTAFLGFLKDPKGARSEYFDALWKMIQTRNDQAQSAYTTSGRTGIEFSAEVEYEKFEINADLELTAGKLQATFKADLPLAKIEFPQRLIGSIGPWVQFYASASASLSFGASATYGLLAENNGLVANAASYSFGLNGALEGKVEASGVGLLGVSGTLSASVGLTVTIPNSGPSTLTFPITVEAEIKATALFGVFEKGLWKQVIFSTTDALHGPYKFMPADESGASLLPDASEPNNSFATAKDFGVVNGSVTIPALTLSDANDTDYFVFRTAASGAGNDAIVFTWGVTNPSVTARLYRADTLALVGTLEAVNATSGRIALAGLPAARYFIVLTGTENLGVDYQVAVHATVPAGPALIAEFMSLPERILTGQFFDVTVRVTNGGTLPSLPVEGALLWSRDELIETTDALLRPAFAIPVLAAGETWTRTFTVSLPAAVTGDLTLAFVVDRREANPDPDRGDQTAVGPLAVWLPADACEPNSSSTNAFDLGGLVVNREITGLTLSHREDLDWFALRLLVVGAEGDAITVTRADGLGSLLLEVTDVAGNVLASSTADRATGVVTLSLAGLAAGDYRILVAADDEAAICYTLALASVPRPVANLSVERVTASSEWLAGDTRGSLLVELANLGGAAAFGFTVKAELIIGGVTYALGAPVTVGTLAAGSRSVLSLPVSVPGIPAGSGVVRITVDAADTVVELVDSDNTLGSAVAVITAFDAGELVEAGNGATTLGTLTGGSIITGRTLHSLFDVDTYDFRLAASGGTLDAFTLTFDPSADVRLQLYDANWNFVASATAPVAGTARLTLNGIAAGFYHALIYASGAATAYSLAIQAPAAPAANITVVSITPVTPLIEGGSVTVTTGFLNNGGAASGTFSYRYYLSSDRVVDAGTDTVLGAAISVAGGLASGATLTDTARVLDLSGVGPGFWYLLVLADSGAVVSESAETDNTGATRVLVYPAPDARESIAPVVIPLVAGAGSISALTLHRGDVDTFRFTSTVLGGDLDLVRVTSLAGESPLVLTLLDSAGFVVLSVGGSAGSVAVSLKALPAGDYTVRVAADTTDGLSTEYAISVVAQGLSVLLRPSSDPLPPPASPTGLITGDLSYAATQLVALAAARWAAALGLGMAPVFDVIFADLGSDRLATVVARRDSAGHLIGGSILLALQPGGCEWFLDSSPYDDSEFALAAGALRLASTDSAAYGRFDLWTTVMHEMGHLYGFEPENEAFAARVVTGTDGALRFVGDGYMEILSADGAHLDANSAPDSLLSPLLAAGQRRLLTGREVALVQTLVGGPVRTVETDSEVLPVIPVLVGNLPVQPVMQWQGSDAWVLPVLPSTLWSSTRPTWLAGTAQISAIVNGGFEITDPLAANFGWLTRGLTILSGGEGRLIESASVQARFQQSIVVPVNAITLEITIAGLSFSANHANPGDAFEISVRNAGFASVAGLTLTDALVNVQADGLTRWGGNASVTDAVSGDNLDYTGSRVFRVNLVGIAAGTVLDVSLDLIGFGAAASSARIADVSVLENRPPVAADQSVDATEGTPLHGVVTATDADGHFLTFALGTGPARGTLVFNADGSFTYTAARQPTVGFGDTDSFTFIASDGYASSALATVGLALTDINSAPVVDLAGFTVAEGATTAGPLNATDADGDDLLYALVSGAAHGTVTVNADGTYSYTAARQPTVGFASTDSFTVQANDGLADSVIRTISVTLTPVNDAPMVAPDSATVGEGATHSGSLSATDVDGDAFSFALVGGPAHGVLTLNADGTFTYAAARQPTVGFVATDSFTVKANDGLADSAPRTVTVTLTPVNDAPLLAAGDVTVAEGAASGGALSASDADGDVLIYSLVSGAAHGLVMLNADGTFTYAAARQPTVGFVATDSFTVQANDGLTDSVIRTISVTLTPVNDAPVVAPDSATVGEGATHSGSLSATDVDGDAFSFALVGGPAHGVLTLNADGTFTYAAARQPTVGFVATDSFTVKANDGLADSAPRTVTVTLTPVNDAPLLAAGDVTVAEGAASGGALSASDADGDVLIYSLVSGAAHGTVTVNADGTYSYTAARQPTVGFVATDSFTVQANDGLADSVIRTISVTLTPVNDAPVVAPVAPFTLDEGATFGGLWSASDADGDALTGLVLGAPSHGVVTVNADGTFSYLADRQDFTTFTAEDHFTLAVRDASGATASVVVTVTIVQIASPPAFILQPAAQVTVTGATVTFTATATGKPAPTYQWFKNGVAIAGAIASTLTLTNVKLSDAGRYTVVATNAIRAVTSDVATLQIGQPGKPIKAPTISRQPASSVRGLVDIGAGFTLKVGARAAVGSLLSYQWRRDGQILVGATGSTYMVSSSVPGDAGRYDVLVTNAGGSVISRPLDVVVSLAPSRMVTGDRLVLTGSGFDSTGAPLVLNANWLVNGRLLDDGDATTSERFTYKRRSNTSSLLLVVRTTKTATRTVTTIESYMLNLTSYDAVTGKVSGTWMLQASYAGREGKTHISGRLSGSGTVLW